MLRSKVLKGLIIPIEELGERLKPWGATGFIEDCRSKHGAKRTFCSCGYEDSKFPSVNTHACPNCKGVLLEKGYDESTNNIIVGRVNGNTFEFYRLHYELEHVAGDSMYNVPVDETFIGSIKRDSVGIIYDCEWKILNRWSMNDSSMNLLLDFFSHDKEKYKTLSYFNKHFSRTSEIEYIKMLTTGLIEYPLIFKVENLERYPKFFREFFYLSINGFLIPTITCLGKRISRDYPIPAGCTMEELLEAFGFPECIYSQMDVTFLSSKTEINNIDVTRDFVKTPLGMIALNRLQNGIIELNEFFQMQEVEYAISNGNLCKRKDYYYDSKYYNTKTEAVFPSEETALFFGYFKDSIDRHMSIKGVIEEFSRHIHALNGAGIVPNVDNIRDRPFNELVNSHKFKMLKNTCLEDLMKTNPLEALSRVRGPL